MKIIKNSNVADLRARKILSEKILDLMNGNISSGNFDDDVWNWSYGITDDEAIFAIVFALWQHYDERNYHDLEAMKPHSKEAEETYKRILLFLKTDLPYQYKYFTRTWWKNIFLEFTFQKRKIVDLRKYWPFASVDDYKMALGKYS